MNDEVPNYGVDVFCNELTTESAIKCDVAHKMAAKCDLVNYTSYDEDAVYPYFNSRSAPSAEYQHFSDEVCHGILSAPGF